MACPADADQRPDRSAELSQALRALAPLLGRWRTSGVLFDREGATVASALGHDTWTPMPGGRWVTHQSATRVGTRLVHLHQVIGGRHPDGGWQMLAFDDGPLPELTQLEHCPDGSFAVQGPDVRATFLPSYDARPMTALWQRQVEDHWLPWMRVRYEWLGPEPAS